MCAHLGETSFYPTPSSGRIVLRFWACQPNETLRHTVPALQAMLLRSGQHPLDIAFAAVCSGNEDAAIKALPMIIKESYRCRSMDLHISLTLLKQSKAVRGKIPCLESLNMTIAALRSDREELPSDVRSMFIDAPRLRKVTLHDVFDLGDFSIPLHITHLASFMRKVSNLEAYQSLVECHLIAKTQPDPNFYPLHSVYLPNVRRLFVLSPDLLVYLCLPSLEDVNISCLGDMSDTRAIVLTMNEFVCRSRCTLVSLVLDHPVAFHQVFITSCVLLMDSLISLDVTPCRNVEVGFLIDALVSPEFLPRLQHVSLPEFDLLWDPLPTMLRIRSQYLRTVKIYGITPYDIDRSNQRLALLWPSGLPIVVSVEQSDFWHVISYFGNFECFFFFLTLYFYAATRNLCTETWWRLPVACLVAKVLYIGMFIL
ncbi:hypothetical protein EDD18DRAFT_349780 [Armillaria luteobubalina]|uniref:Uncharacterized protein n=1 Tax=Armillaria luteobubalina TaxID=153913 RepID=A0AA39Q1M4_9AGAR|nr:hypothetical protein EDD18DRAFT_349780 [Armillaria luteobubalina]